MMTVIHTICKGGEIESVTKYNFADSTAAIEFTENNDGIFVFKDGDKIVDIK